MKDILGAQGLKMQEGEKCPRDKVYESDVVHGGQCAINRLNQGVWMSQGKPQTCL